MTCRRPFRILAIAALAGAGCGDPAGPGVTTDFGAAVNLGQGVARTYVVSEGGTPTEIGIALSAAALEGLPAPTGPMDSHSFLLPLPAGQGTDVQLVELNWNPAGHPPPMVYTVPHFDFHFYTVSLAERNAILPTDPGFAAKAANLPAASLQPPGYVPPAMNGSIEAVPMMGVHWVDPTGPEFTGSPFTSTFIYGSWDGHFTFLEPMVTLDFLKTQPTLEKPIPVPAHFETDGYRPAAYRVSYDAKAGEYRIGLTKLRFIAKG